MSDSTPEVLLDLAKPRIVAFTDRGRDYRFECRRLTDGDWKRYFDSIVVSNEQRGPELVRISDFNTGLIALAEAVLISAQGYKVAGGAELMSLPDWQRNVPSGHRLKIGDVLASATPSKSGELVIFPEAEVAILDATWSALEGGKMQRVIGLQHVLSSPTEDQHRRYRNESSRSFVQGGSRAGKTVYRSTYPLLAKLYDEMVISVDGYAVDGVKLTNDKATIVREMDMYHKAIAARLIFQPDMPEMAADGDEG